MSWGRSIGLKVKNAGALEIHAIEVHFVGYNIEAKGFCVHWPGHGQRARKPPGFYHKLNEGKASIAESSMEDVAAFFKVLEEEDDDNSDLQQDAIETLCYSQVVEFVLSEFTQLEKLNTWDIVKTPVGANIIQCHYILTIKCNVFNEILKHKVTSGKQNMSGISGMSGASGKSGAKLPECLSISLQDRKLNLNWMI
ncbi:hypothetical protein B0H10DRAFT_1955898 [Mycena sp. CBHHK59/15]|nr:hypothetical protein B0H10DRAFT_1955898 [Mycena sp. CBHHK59/15]